MNDQIKITFLIGTFVVLAIIIVIISILMIKRKHAENKNIIEHKVYDLPSESPNVQLFGIETKHRQKNEYNEEELAKTKLISLHNFEEVKNLADESDENSELPKLK